MEALLLSVVTQKIFVVDFVCLHHIDRVKHEWFIIQKQKALCCVLNNMNNYFLSAKYIEST